MFGQFLVIMFQQYDNNLHTLLMYNNRLQCEFLLIRLLRDIFILLLAT